MPAVQSQVSPEQVAGFFQRCRETCLADSHSLDLDVCLSSLRDAPPPPRPRAGPGRPRLRRGVFAVEREMPVPECLRQKVDSARVLSRLGVFPEIGHIWVSVDNELFLYDYLSGTRIRTVSADTVIQYALLFTPRPGVFSHDTRYCLLIGFSDHVRIYALLYPSDFLEAVTLVGRASASAAAPAGAGVEDAAHAGLQAVDTNSYYQMAGPGGPGAGQRGLISALEFTIADTGLSCPLQSGVKITCMETTSAPSSRLFLGMTDGDVYELCYEAPRGDGPVTCRLVCRSSVPVLSHVPFVNELLNKRSIKQICVDNARGVLYALHENDRISCYLLQASLPEDGGPGSRVAAYVPPRPQDTYFRKLRPYTLLPQDLAANSLEPSQICQIRVVSRCESKTIHLVASLQSGAQVYFTLLPAFQASRLSRLYTGDLRDTSAMGSAGQQGAGLDDGIADQIGPSSVLTAKHVLPPPQFRGSGGSGGAGREPDVFGTQAPGDFPVGISSVYGYARSNGCEFFYDRSGLYASFTDLSYYPRRGKDAAVRSGELVEEVVAGAESDIIMDVVELQPELVQEFADIGFAGSPGQVSGWGTGAAGTGAFLGLSNNVTVPLHPSLIAANQFVYQYSSPGRMFVVLSATTVYVLRLRRPLDFVIDSLADSGSVSPAILKAWGQEEVSAMLLSLAMGGAAAAEPAPDLGGTYSESSAAYLERISQRASALFASQFAESGYQAVLLYVARVLRPVLVETFWIASDAQTGGRAAFGAGPGVASAAGVAGAGGFSGAGLSVAMARDLRTSSQAGAQPAPREAGVARSLSNLMMGIVRRAPDAEADLHALSAAEQGLAPGLIAARDTAALSGLRLTNSQLRWNPLQVFGLSLSLSMLTSYLNGGAMAHQVSDYDYRVSMRQPRAGGFGGEYGQAYGGGYGAGYGTAYGAGYGASYGAGYGPDAQFGAQRDLSFRTLIDSISYAREVLVFVALVTDPSRLVYSSAVLNRFARDYGHVVYLPARPRDGAAEPAAAGTRDQAADARDPGLLSRLVGRRRDLGGRRRGAGDRAFFACDLLSVPGLLRPEAQGMIEELVRVLSVGGTAPAPGGLQSAALPTSQASLASTRLNPRRQISSQRFLVQLAALCPMIHDRYSVRIRGLALLAAAGASSTPLHERNQNIAEAIRLFTTLQLAIRPIEPILQALVDLHASGSAIRLALAITRRETYDVVTTFAEKFTSIPQQLQEYHSRLVMSGTALFEELVGVRGDQSGAYARLDAFYDALLRGTYTELYTVQTFISDMAAQISSSGGGLESLANQGQELAGPPGRAAPSGQARASSLVSSLKQIQETSANIFSILQSVYLFPGISDVVSNASPGIQGNQAIEGAVTGCDASLWHYELYCWLYSHYYHLGCIAAGLRTRLGLAEPSAATGGSAGAGGAAGAAGPAAGPAGQKAAYGVAGAPGEASTSPRFGAPAQGGWRLLAGRKDSGLSADFRSRCATVLAAAELVQKRCRTALVSILTPHIEEFLRIFDYELHVLLLERRGKVMNACRVLFRRATDPATQSVFPRLLRQPSRGPGASLRASARSGAGSGGEVRRSLSFSARRALLMQAQASLQSPALRVQSMKEPAPLGPGVSYGGVSGFSGAPGPSRLAEDPELDAGGLSVLLSSVSDQLRVARLQQALLDRLNALCYLAAGPRPRGARGGQPAREELGRSLSAGLGCSALALDPDEAAAGAELPQLEEAAHRLEEGGLASLECLRDEFALRFRLYDLVVVILLHEARNLSAWRLQLTQAWIHALTRDIPGYATLGAGAEAERKKAFAPLCDISAAVAEARQACPEVAEALKPSGELALAVSDRALRMGVVLANILLTDAPLSDDGLTVPVAVAAAQVLQFLDSGFSARLADAPGAGPGAPRSAPAEVALGLLCNIAFDSFTGGLFRANQAGVDYKSVIPMMIGCIKQCLYDVCKGLQGVDAELKARGAGNLRGAAMGAPLSPIDADRHFEVLYAKLPDSSFRNLDKRAFGHALCYLWKYLALTFVQLVNRDPFDQGGMARVPLAEQRDGVCGFLAMLGVEDRGLAMAGW